MSNDFEPELVIGLVSAVGTENSSVINLLTERLGLAGYRVHPIKISAKVIPLLCPVADCGNDQYQRISNHMDAGNKARADSKDDSILALGVAALIYANREKNSDNSTKESPKTAYIIDSLKRPEEVNRLRSIYPLGFVLIGIHADEDRRRDHLTADRGMTSDNANDLMRRDGEESLDKHGQRVNKTFHMADFFVRISQSRDRLRCDVARMVELWFGNPYVTPIFDEHAMFMAFGAALRSADMSRQVGAVITYDSQILATGANDCPKAGGGLYWPERNGKGCIADHPNGRDYTRKNGDSNRAEQILIINRIVDEGTKAGLDPETLKQLLSNSSLRDLTEYGRVVHAEMEALLSCARNGRSTVGATLYCTTFPCHNCAKHIVAAGIKRVVYVEPYPKSKALEFHDDSIITSGESGEDGNGLVVFEGFVGIGPRRFFDLFSMQLGSSYELVRKDDQGRKIDWRIDKSRIRIQMKPTTYLEDEAVACNMFVEHRNRFVQAPT